MPVSEEAEVGEGTTAELEPDMIWGVRCRCTVFTPSLNWSQFGECSLVHKPDPQLYAPITIINLSLWLLSMVSVVFSSLSSYV